MRIFTIIVSILLIVPSVSALPFNDDMVENQISTGQIVRPRPENSIAIGSLKNKVRSKEEAKLLENPIKADESSVLRGEMLFESNCFACHGKMAIDSHYVPAAGKQIGAPNLAMEFYKSRTDGEMYGTIHFGSIIMPSVGWKLSPDETWDIINYVRSVQNKEGSK